MPSVRIKGGPELRARIANLRTVGPEMKRAWSGEAAQRIRSGAPVRSGLGRASIRAGEKAGKAGVFGRWYLIIQDRGTKAYRIEPKTPGGTLRFNYRGRTVFARASNRRRLRRRPFITKGAQDALRVVGVDQIIQAWNRKRSRGRFSRLSL